MSLVYLTEQGAKIQKTGDRILVSLKGKELAELECYRLDAVMIFGNVQITTQALKEMLSHGVELALFTKSGELLGQLTPPAARNIALRKSQYAKEKSESFTIRQSIKIVKAKLKNSSKVLVRHAYDNPKIAEQLKEAAKKIKTLAEKTSSSENLSSLTGIEGAGARQYWRVFGSMLKREEVEFPGRISHPSPDPVNAVLSFGYVLLGNELRWLIDGIGFDPFLGFYHQESYGRPSLALDLLEPFRAPVVDRLCVRLFNLGTLKNEDFRPDGEGGVRLSREAMKKFFISWEKHLARLQTRAALKASAEQLARVFKDEEDLVKPWLWEPF